MRGLKGAEPWPSGTVTTCGSVSYKEKKISRPFPSYPKPLSSEAKCEAIDMKLIFNSHANKTNFLKRGFLIGLVLKVRVFGTQK